jgi:hypothetical protein
MLAPSKNPADIAQVRERGQVFFRSFRQVVEQSHDLTVKRKQLRTGEDHQFIQGKYSHFISFASRPRKSRPFGRGTALKEASRIACDRNEEKECMALAAHEPTKAHEWPI